MLSSLSAHTGLSEALSSQFLSSYSVATILAFIMFLKCHALPLCTMFGFYLRSGHCAAKVASMSDSFPGRSFLIILLQLSDNLSLPAEETPLAFVLA